MQWQEPAQDARMAELDRIIAREPEKPAKRPASGKNRPLPMNRRSHNEMCSQCSTRFCDHVMPEVPVTWYRARLLLALTNGWSNQEVADYLGVEDRSVNVYVSTTCRITGLTSRLELALWAMGRREKLLEIIANGTTSGKRPCANF